MGPPGDSEAQPSPAQGSRADAFDLKDTGAAYSMAQTCLEEGTACGLQMLQAKRTRCGLSCIPARAASPSSSSPDVCLQLSAADAGAALGSASTVINVCQAVAAAAPASPRHHSLVPRVLFAAL